MPGKPRFEFSGDGQGTPLAYYQLWKLLVPSLSPSAERSFYEETG